MKLEDQVCSLELANRLKELGVKRESLYRWCQFFNRSAVGEGAFTRFTTLETVEESKEIRQRSYIEKFEFFAAFTVAELGEMLPPDTPSGNGELKFGCWMMLSEDGDESYWDDKNIDDPMVFWESTEADARARMLIHLIENKLMTPKETTPND